MKKSELRKLISEYKELESKLAKSKDKRVFEKLEEIKRQYYHETGQDLKSNLKTT